MGHEIFFRYGQLSYSLLQHVLPHANLSVILHVYGFYWRISVECLLPLLLSWFDFYLIMDK